MKPEYEEAFSAFLIAVRALNKKWAFGCSGNSIRTEALTQDINRNGTGTYGDCPILAVGRSMCSAVFKPEDDACQFDNDDYNIVAGMLKATGMSMPYDMPKLIAHLADNIRGSGSEILAQWEDELDGEYPEKQKKEFDALRKRLIEACNLPVDHPFALGSADY